MASKQDALRAADRLMPLIRKHVTSVQEKRSLPVETIAALSEAGLFTLMTPARYGGSELGLGVLISTTARIAESCGSTAWVFQVFAGHNWLISLFEPEAQGEIFESANPLTASCTRATGDIRRTKGGVLLRDVQGRFCSGIDHAGWIALVASITDAGGKASAGIVVVPQSSAQIVDDWHTSGMRGTGSKSFRISELLVPDCRVLTMATIAAGDAPGLTHSKASIYRAPFPQILPLQLAGAPLGLAKAGLNAFIETKREKLSPSGESELAEHTPTYLLISNTAAEVDAACALLTADFELIDETGTPESLTPLNRARYIRNVSYAVQKWTYPDLVERHSLCFGHHGLESNRRFVAEC